jgi:uncharacterized YccA/Bax inhibitor family protein
LYKWGNIFSEIFCGAMGVFFKMEVFKTGAMEVFKKTEIHKLKIWLNFNPELLLIQL